MLPARDALPAFSSSDCCASACACAPLRLANLSMPPIALTFSPRPRAATVASFCNPPWVTDWSAATEPSETLVAASAPMPVMPSFWPELPAVPFRLARSSAWSPAPAKAADTSAVVLAVARRRSTDPSAMLAVASLAKRLMCGAVSVLYRFHSAWPTSASARSWAVSCTFPLFLLIEGSLKTRRRSAPTRGRAPCAMRALCAS